VSFPFLLADLPEQVGAKLRIGHANRSFGKYGRHLHPLQQKASARLAGGYVRFDMLALSLIDLVVNVAGDKELNFFATTLLHT
jgi:hypothetical protein